MESNQINYLFKDEIQYELVVRNVPFNEDFDTNDLRKLLRKSINTNVLPSVAKLSGKFTMSSEIKNCQTKLDFSQTLLESLQEDKKSKPKIVNKLSAKLKHLNHRISNLEQCRATSDQQEAIKILRENFNKLFSEFNQVKETFDQGELSSADSELNQSFLEDESQEEEQTNSNLKVSTGDATSQEANVLVSQAVLTQKNVENQLSSLTHVTSVVSEPTFCQVENQCIAQNTLENQGLPSIENSLPSIFCKIQNPLDHQIQKFTSTDGLKISELLDFLKDLLKVQHSKISLSDIYLILENVSKGPLLSKIKFCINNNMNIGQIHKSVVDTFIPMPLLSRLKEDFVHRPQKTGEPFSVYLYEIKNFSNLLLCNYSEKSLVDYIMSGLNPQVRSQISIYDYPKCLMELEELCIASQTVSYKDMQREQLTQAPHGNNATPPPAYYTPSPTRPPHARQYSSRYQGHEAPRRCYICNKLGHIARNCLSKNL